MSRQQPRSLYPKPSVPASCVRPQEQELAAAISAAIVELDASLYGRPLATATTYLDDKIVLCVLESGLTAVEHALVTGASPGEATGGPIALQADTKRARRGAVERRCARREAAKPSRRPRKRKR